MKYSSLPSPALAADTVPALRTRHFRIADTAFACLLVAFATTSSTMGQTFVFSGAEVTPFATPRGATPGDTTFVLGIPGVPEMTNTTVAAENPWLAENYFYAPMAIVAPTGGVSRIDSIGAPLVRLEAAEGGFAIERAKPDYYLADQVSPPDDVDWAATYAAFLERPAAEQLQFIFDDDNRRLFVVKSGTLSFTWVLDGGATRDMVYNVSSTCSGRPRRIYWTDHPYNAPAIDLNGKFVKFFGPDALIKPVLGVVTNSVAGMEQVVSNTVVSGLHIDPSTHLLYAYGQLQGQVVMAFYDTGLYERLLHVQAVEICRPIVNRMTGDIGRPLKPDGRGYGTAGLRARPTYYDPADNRGDYYYQHQGKKSYSPKHGNVYPLRPTTLCPWNMEVYWMETDEMLVDWPFELDQYACDWPSDATVFVRGDVNGDGGRPIYVPSDYSATLMGYQEPEGHARAVEADGTFKTVSEGWSLLRLTTDDNVWFVPIHSISRSNTKYFTLEPEEIRVGMELGLRGGSVAGLAPGFTPICDPDSPGYIYETASDPVWNAGLYKAPQPDNADTAAATNMMAEASSSSSDTNKYASVIYAVTANSATEKASSPKLEVWWNTTIKDGDMPSPLTIPTLPQVYSIRWPKEGETPQIVIASQLGSSSESMFSHNAALFLSSSNSTVTIPSRKYFDENEGGTLMFWAKTDFEFTGEGQDGSVVTLADDNGRSFTVDFRASGGQTNVCFTLPGGWTYSCPLAGNQGCGNWLHIAVVITNVPTANGPSCRASCYVNGRLPGIGAMHQSDSIWMWAVAQAHVGAIGAMGGLQARPGVTVGELLMWNRPLSLKEIREEMFKVHAGRENHLTGCYNFIYGTDLSVTGTDHRTFTEKVLGTPCLAYKCLLEENGPPAIGTGVINADSETTPRIYAQNDPEATGYNPNEEHALVMSGAGGYVAWALRNDMNTASSSIPGVLVEFAKDGRKTMQWFDVTVTNAIYPELAADCVAGRAFPGPHPIDMMDDPWCVEDTWDEPSATAPAFRDRKGQLWARAAGTATMRMFYRMQDGFAFPSLPRDQWPAIGSAIPWLSLLGGDPASSAVLSATPAAWTWRVRWPDVVPEMQIGRTLTVAASGLPEVWNSGSVGVVWPATDAERDATAVLFDPTVAQTAGFDKSTFSTVSAAVTALGIKQGAGGNATLRKGRWTFDGLPPSLSKRFYLDTTADVTSCLKLEGEMENNPGGVSLLHVNVLNDEERKVLSTLLDDKANATGKTAWKAAIAKLATAPVRPSKHKTVSTVEDRIDYQPRDHYALFTMGATNYITLIQNDSTNELMSVAEGDPISMHLLKVVPEYYVGRVVTREDPLNMLSQQLSIIYAEAFAGKPDDYIFEWRKCRPHANGTVPVDYEGEYTRKFEPTAGLTRFVIGAQGDTLANMVNTYYTVRYKAASPSSPAYAAMGDAWSQWTDPPVLAEGWVQRVLNNVTPFAQRMRDLVDNKVESAISMIRQAGAPYEGDVALSQDNLSSIGLIQLYETLLSKAESMSLLVGIDDGDANKQLQLAVARLADLYSLLGDEAWTDALNPTIGFGSNFNTTSMTGLELDYGMLSSTLFAFDNQVPTLLDEELALLRGRSGANAPSTHLSPYYNRLVWNFSKGITAGEVAYAVNYDISGNNRSVIEEEEAAEMFPQGHGDAYGHYLSALSGYYRLLRNPYFSWGAPAMGEMVVADAVLNVDYYDEAKFAKAAYDVAKVASLVVDRTARKAFRDNGGAAGAGYIDSATSRNFGYGEWASRGGFGALANWAVANALLDEAPDGGRYYRYAFDGAANDTISAIIPESVPEHIDATMPWLVEFQLVPDSAEAEGAAEEAPVFCISDSTHGLSFTRDADSGEVSAVFDTMLPTTNTLHCAYWFYTNSVDSADADDKDLAEVSVRVGDSLYSCLFVGNRDFPTAFPEGYDPAVSFATDPPVFAGWDCITGFTKESYDSEGGTNVVETLSGMLTYEEDEVVSLTSATPMLRVPIGVAPAGQNNLVALRMTTPSARDCEAILLNPSGALLSSVSFLLPEGFSIDLSDSARAVLGGGAYGGEIGEIRVWAGAGAVRSNSLLQDKREFVSPVSDSLVMYLRPFADSPATYLPDQAEKTIKWSVSGGRWIEASESGMNIAFDDDGLLRIDRSTVPELSALANMIPDIQKKVDRMDAGLTPLGLADGAMAFDLTPISPGEDGATHYEQIRERAGTALENARRSLDKAQFYASRLRLLQESQVWQDQLLDTMELETKNALIEYFGYPYEGDIGPGGTYEQGYDGPDIYNYAWMEPKLYGLTKVEDVVSVTKETKVKPKFLNILVPFLPSSSTESTSTLTFEKSATGIILKPDKITGKRRAQGKIQDAMADFLIAYAGFDSKIDTYKNKLDDFEVAVTIASTFAAVVTYGKAAMAFAGTLMDYFEAAKKVALKTSINALEFIKEEDEDLMTQVLGQTPAIVGAGMTVNTDPRSIVAAGFGNANLSWALAIKGSITTAKNALVETELEQDWKDIAKGAIEALADIAEERISTYMSVRDAWYELRDAASELNGAYRELQVAQSAVETVVAEAERIIDTRTLARQQSADLITKARYNEMFFRLARNNALTRYDAQFDLAQKYAYLAAQAYDYETGLLSSDRASGDAFLARIVGARTLGEFDDDGNPLVASDGAKGDGGLAAILAEMDENWLVLKPRLGINNPQPYATWFSLRHDLFRIYDGDKGDKAWRTELRKYIVEDLNSVSEFRRYCQPLAGSDVEKEPGFVIPFPTTIASGSNFFGKDLEGGDAALDPTYFATHISAAGIHFEGYDDDELSRTPTAYLVPVGEDRMRAVGDPETIISWQVVDQTIPAPYAIGSTQLDDPDWTPLYDGATGGNDLGARIRKHPSFRAYYDEAGKDPSDDSLDCTRLVGRSAWNTRWLLIIPASSLSSDREGAIATFVNSVTDLKLGLKTYSTSGN